MLRLITFVLILFVVEDCQTDDLKLVSVLYRHGDRSPVSIFPLDKNQVDAWSDGLGWLTNLGKQQQFELGQFIKQRYSGFLNTSHYHHNEILVQSSSIDRCLMSAYSHLAGLYAPQGQQIWNPNISWQPIPVQTTPMSMDNKLALSAPCPKYNKLLDDVLQDPEIQKEEQENKAFYEMVENKTGIIKETVKDIWSVADPLNCEQIHNMTWNDWVYKPGVWEKLLTLNSLSYAVYTYTAEMSRLMGGPLLKEIVTNMQAATKKDPSPKFYMYSAHDTTVAALLAAMHVYDRHAPIYSAMVIVELHQIQSDHLVKIFYKNSTGQPFELTPPVAIHLSYDGLTYHMGNICRSIGGCQNPCRLEDFISLTNDTVPIDWEKECQLTDGTKTTGDWRKDCTSGATQIANTIFALVFLISLLTTLPDLLSTC